jgi:hypothetical protein
MRQHKVNLAQAVFFLRRLCQRQMPAVNRIERASEKTYVHKNNFVAKLRKFSYRNRTTSLLRGTTLAQA